MQRKSTALVGVAVVAALVFALGAGAAGAAKHGPGGNSAAAKACQGTGYLDLVREDGTAFGTPGACVGYAARGGTLAPKRTWKGVCTDDLAGSFSKDASNNTIIWFCDWFGIPKEKFEAFGEALEPWCPGTQLARTWFPPGEGRANYTCLTGLPA
jgi:hypothetical protein